MQSRCQLAADASRHPRGTMITSGRVLLQGLGQPRGLGGWGGGRRGGKGDLRRRSRTKMTQEQGEERKGVERLLPFYAYLYFKRKTMRMKTKRE